MARDPANQICLFDPPPEPHKLSELRGDRHRCRDDERWAL